MMISNERYDALVQMLDSFLLFLKKDLQITEIDNLMHRREKRNRKEKLKCRIRLFEAIISTIKQGKILYWERYSTDNYIRILKEFNIILYSKTSAKRNNIPFIDLVPLANARFKPPISRLVVLYLLLPNNTDIQQRLDVRKMTYYDDILTRITLESYLETIIIRCNDCNADFAILQFRSAVLERREFVFPYSEIKHCPSCGKETEVIRPAKNKETDDSVHNVNQEEFRKSLAEMKYDLKRVLIKLLGFDAI